MEFVGKATIVSSMFTKYQNPAEENVQKECVPFPTTDYGLGEEQGLELGKILNLVLLQMTFTHSTPEFVRIMKNMA